MEATVDARGAFRPHSGLMIRATALRFSWGDQLVLGGIDLDLGPGRVLGYVGVNGAGKTTTLRLLAGLLEDYEGELVVAGHDLSKEKDAAKECIGYVPETAALFESLTLAETLLLVGRLRGMEDELIRARGEALAEVLDLSNRLDRPVDSLSKGMRQKLLLMLALLHDPRVLLLDEPFTGLDASSRLFLGQALRALAERGRTIVVSSHALDLVERFCDEVALLDEGRIVARGALPELLAQGDRGTLFELVEKLRAKEEVSVEDRVDHLLRSLDA